MKFTYNTVFAVFSLRGSSQQKQPPTLPTAVNLEICERILFSRIALKLIFVTLKNTARAFLPISVNDGVITPFVRILY